MLRLCNLFAQLILHITQESQVYHIVKLPTCAKINSLTKFMKSSYKNVHTKFRWFSFCQTLKEKNFPRNIPTLQKGLRSKTKITATPKKTELQVKFGSSEQNLKKP